MRPAGIDLSLSSRPWRRPHTRLRSVASLWKLALLVDPLTGPSPYANMCFRAGAVGSHLAVRLALSGHDVSCVMRGPHLEAVKAKRPDAFVSERRVFSSCGRASDDPAAAGSAGCRHQHVEGNRLSSLVTGLPPLLRDDTAIVFAQNGIPWWTISGFPRSPAAARPWFLDPGGRLRAVVAKERIVGGVIFSANEIVEPGIVVNNSTDRNMLLVGECDDRPSERIEHLRAVLEQASFQSPQVGRIGRLSGPSC